MSKEADAAELSDKPESGDAPLIDLNEASVKKLLARAKKRGYITYDELNAALPQDVMSSDQIEDIMSGKPPRPPKDWSPSVRPSGGPSGPSGAVGADGSPVTVA